MPRYDVWKKPRAQFYCTSLKDWIKAVFASKTLAFLVRSAKRHVPVPGRLTDIWDGEVWKSTIEDWAGDNAHWLGFSIVTDPIQVYETSQSSICPLIMSLNNLPKWLRHLSGTKSRIFFVRLCHLLWHKLLMIPFLIDRFLSSLLVMSIAGQLSVIYLTNLTPSFMCHFYMIYECTGHFMGHFHFFFKELSLCTV